MCRSDTVKEICIAVRCNLIAKLTVNHSLEIKLVFALRGHSVDKYLVGKADEALTGIVRIAWIVTDRCDSGFKVKVTDIISRTHILHWSDYEFSELKIPLRRIAVEVLFDIIPCFDLLILKDELTSLFEMLNPVFYLVAVAWTRPKRIKIETECFGLNTAEHHCAEAAVSYRQSFDPCGCRVAVP